MDILESIDGLLMEMKVHKDQDDYDSVLAYKGDIWLFSSMDIKDETAKHMKDTLGFTTEPLMFTDVRKEVSNTNRADILLGMIRGNELEITLDGPPPDPKSSILVKRVVDEIGVDSVSYSAFDFTVRSDKEDIKGEIPDKMLHGTASNYLGSILKRGLRPGEGESNFENLDYREVVFLTTRPEKAMFHAQVADENNSGSAIILEVEVPDKAKLMPDYDIDTMADMKYYGHVDHDLRDNHRGQQKTMSTHSMGASREFGAYGYAGTILPQKITRVFLPTSVSLTYGLGADFDDFNPVSRKDAIKWLDYAKNNDINLGEFFEFADKLPTKRR